MKVKIKVLVTSHVQLFVTPWTIAHQAPLSMEFSRQEYWSGLPCPSPRDLPDSGTKPGSLTLQADSLPSDPPRKFSMGEIALSKKKKRQRTLCTMLHMIAICIHYPLNCLLNVNNLNSQPYKRSILQNPVIMVCKKPAGA